MCPFASDIVGYSCASLGFCVLVLKEDCIGTCVIFCIVKGCKYFVDIRCDVMINLDGVDEMCICCDGKMLLDCILSTFLCPLNMVLMKSLKVHIVKDFTDCRPIYFHFRVC